jgi:aspartate/methionine/tyrosine aminotransferase
VLVPRPSYPLFDYLANMESVEVRQYPLVYHGGWAIDLDGLAGAVTDRTRAVVLVHPNNPTGSYVKTAEVEALVRLCRERGLALLSDEVFSDYAFGADSGRAGTLATVTGCLTFSMSGLSKIAGLPQMKLGWIAVNGPADLRQEALDKLEWIADTYLSVSAPVQCAAGALLAAGESVQSQIRQRCTAHLALARRALDGSAANILAVEGGWYITIQVPRIRSEEEWALDLLARHNVLVQPGFFYDFESEAYLVVSLLTAPEFFGEGIGRLRRQLAEA